LVNIGAGFIEVTLWQKLLLAYSKLATGAAVMVIGRLVVDTGQPPEGAMVLVTVYVPGVEAARSISPILLLAKTRPAPAVNVPALDPTLIVGIGLVPLEQKLEAL
jgi:hypothetical protein